MDQFASVLAHEIGHVVLRHSVKQMRADAGRQLRRDDRVRAHGSLQQRASRRRESTSPDRRFSRSSAGTTRRRPTRPASTSWFARASTRTGCRRCSRSCSPSAQNKPDGARRVVHGPPARGETASRPRETRSPQINPAIIRTLTTNTQAFNDFKARVRTLPPPPTSRR